MSVDELGALIADLDTVRFTLEDAERSADGWVVYLYETHSGLTFRVSDYPLYRRRLSDFPTAWITDVHRVRRNGRDYSATNAAITLPEVARILADDRAHGPEVVRAIHVRYDEDDDHRYTVCITISAEPEAELRCPNLATYHRARRPPGQPDLLDP